MWKVGFGAAFVVLVAVSCSSGASHDKAAPATTPITASAPSTTVARVDDGVVWLCRPGIADNPCETDPTTTVIAEDGTSTVEPFSPAADPSFDCFYVYPTVSTQPTAYANLDIDDAEIAVANAQASRFSQVCRVFAPMYRQRTLSGIFNPDAPSGDGDAAQAYADVAAAWKSYLKNDNAGRGVVLIGHSQGTMMLTTLIQNEIDDVPTERARIISALLIGGFVTVAAGSDVGGSFQHVPVCRAVTDTGCVVAYSSFAETPEESARFGTGGEGLSGVCTNPAALAGGPAALHPAFPVGPSLLGGLGLDEDDVATPWVSYPGLLTAECRSNATHTWLEVTAHRVPGDKRPELAGTIPGWGLHTLDMNVAAQDLIDLVLAQADAWKP